MGRGTSSALFAIRYFCNLRFTVYCSLFAGYSLNNQFRPPGFHYIGMTPPPPCPLPVSCLLALRCFVLFAPDRRIPPANPASGPGCTVIQPTMCPPATVSRCSRQQQPPRRVYAPVFWTGKDGTFWIYGGKDVTSHYLSELWRFDPDTRMWTWMKGDSGLVDQPPTFGSKGVSAPTNSPGRRGLGCPAWTDTSGNLWMFGGSAEATDRLLSHSGICRMSGSTTSQPTNGPGWPATPLPGARVLGTRGVPSTLNLPGQIGECSDAWTDPDNNFWFYGGGVDFYPDYVLWRFNPRQVNGPGCRAGRTSGTRSGTRGVFDSQNLPGQRFAHTSWTGNDGRFWLLGGASEGLVYTDFLNDLWCYDPQTNQWAWYAGDNAISDVDHTGPLCQASRYRDTGQRHRSPRRLDRCRWQPLEVRRHLRESEQRFTYYQSLLWCFVMARKQWMLVESPYPIRRTPSISPGAGVLGQPDVNSHPGSRCGTASFKDRNGRFYPVRRPLPQERHRQRGRAERPLELNPIRLPLLAGIDETSHAAAAIVPLPQPAEDRVSIQQSDATPYTTVDLLDCKAKPSSTKACNAIPNLS